MALDKRLVAALGPNFRSTRRRFRRETSPDDRIEMVTWLAHVDLQYWTPMGEWLVNDPSARVRSCTAISLGITHDERAVPLIDVLAGDRVTQVRWSAALGALENGSARGFGTVAKLLLDQELPVRVAAFSAFVELNTLYPGLASDLPRLDERLGVGSGLDSDTLERLQHDLKNIFATTQGTTLLNLRPPFLRNDARARRPIGALPMLLNVHSQEFTDVDSGLLRKLSDLGETPTSLFVPPGDLPAASPPPPPPPPPPPTASTPPDNGDTGRTRYVNSWFVGHPDPMTPLRFRQEYELGIQVDPDPRIGTLTLEPEFTEPSFGEEESIEVVCVVVSDDFAMLDKPAKRMRLPRDMRLSSSPVTFRVQPIRNNQNVRISVLFYQGNNLFHEALVGATVQVVPELPAELVSAYFKTRDQFRSVFRGPRDMNLQIIEVPRGYRMVLFHDFGADDADAVWCTLPFNRTQLSDLLEGVRNELLQAVHIEGVGPGGTRRRVFFDGEPPAVPLVENRLPNLYDVQREAYEDALRRLARAGRRLFVGLFSQTGGTPQEREQAAHMGELLTELSVRGQLRIQVLADEFFIPWNLLYTGQFPAARVDPTGFWGFRHIIEEIPFRTGSEQVELRTPTTSSEVSVAFNINRTIEPDPSRSQALVEPHLALARSLGKSARVSQRFEEDEVLSALRGEQPHSILEYFYCHAGTSGQASQDFDQSYLGLTDSDSGLTLEDIKLATFRTRLDDGPLFFLNACESGRMDGRFYDGFAPKLLSMGASAVVGTDCEVPSLFAAHFGLDFLHGLLAGEQVGEILLRLRQKFLEEFHNPLGLVYRAFGNVDTRTAPTGPAGETNR